VEKKKKIIVGSDDVSVEDGKLIIACPEVAKAFEDQAFSLDGEEGDNFITFAPSITKN